MALHTQKKEEDIQRDFQRPRYFTPYEAASYGLIDKVGIWMLHCAAAYDRVEASGLRMPICNVDMIPCLAWFES